VTDANQETGEGPRPGPAFILVGPQMGENIGAAARAMWNFGLDRMRIVNPRDGWPNPKAVAMASGAGRLLDEAMIAPTTAEACADLTQIFATTARDRAMTKRVLTPERAMEEARAMISAGERVGILFGPERSGLESADVIRSNAVITVPVNPAFSSLNLAQCVLLMAYEWRRATADVAAPRMDTGPADWAVQDEVARLADHYEARMEEAGFFFPERKAASMKLTCATCGAGCA